MIKQERIDDFKFVLHNVDEVFKDFEAKDIVPLMNNYSDYDVIISGNGEFVRSIWIDHESRTIELMG